jgi:Zn finger protein HypA/HybF involved in hydrogenase expression
MRKIPKKEIEESVVETQKAVEENVEEALEKEESFSLKVEVPRATAQEIIDAIKPNIRICNECHTGFIKRKGKLVCPMCHSTDIS